MSNYKLKANKKGQPAKTDCPDGRHKSFTLPCGYPQIRQSCKTYNDYNITFTFCQL